MRNFEKMVMNLGDFLISPIGVAVGIMLLVGILGIAVLTKRVQRRKKPNTYAHMRERLGQELLIEISEALNRAANENQPAKLRVRKISTDFIKMVAVDSYAFHESKGSRLLEVEIKPLRVLPIIIKKGATREETQQLAPGQLAALCEAVRNYDPVKALR